MLISIIFHVLHATPTLPSHHDLLDLLSDKVEVLQGIGNNTLDLLVGPDKLDLVLEMLDSSGLPYNITTKNLQEDIDAEAEENEEDEVAGVEVSGRRSEGGSGVRSCSSMTGMSWTR